MAIILFIQLLRNPSTAIIVVMIELPAIAATAKKANTYEITHLIYISLKRYNISAINLIFLKVIVKIISLSYLCLLLI